MMFAVVTEVNYLNRSSTQLGVDIENRSWKEAYINFLKYNGYTNYKSHDHSNIREWINSLSDELIVARNDLLKIGIDVCVAFVYINHETTNT